MNDTRPTTLVCRCGKKSEPFYNPMTQHWILPTPPCFDGLRALEKNEGKAGVQKRPLDCTPTNDRTDQKARLILDDIARFLKHKNVEHSKLPVGATV